MNWWQGILTAAGGGGLVTILGFLLSRSEKASALAGTAMTSMKGSLIMQERLRQALWQQSQALNEWEDWGRQVGLTWEALLKYLDDHDGNGGSVYKDLPMMPLPPKVHVDLTKLFDDEK